jgi:hypothetical protein
MFVYHLYQWVDALYKNNSWYEAQIVAVSTDSRNEKAIRIHYKGWKSECDEMLSVCSFAQDAARIAPLHTHTNIPFVPREMQCDRVGTRLWVLDTVNHWEEAIITNVDYKHQLVKVHYVGWNARYDEWINRDSYRLAPSSQELVALVALQAQGC